jgi:SAM-dependent methyltransferase
MIARSKAQLRHHFEVERELASRLKAATRLERPTLYAVLYEELFKRVPDHPRLTRRDTPEESKRAVNARLNFVKHLLTPATVFLEIAPGDCRFAFEVATHAGRVIGLDISDQTGGLSPPPNFELVVFDGIHLEFAPNSVDVAFSFQFLEHIHPEDVPSHFQAVHRFLKTSGVYVFDTPHRFTGPHDISRGFTDEPEGFHLKEWTYRELAAIAEAAGFTNTKPARRALKRLGPLGWPLIWCAEVLASCLPQKIRRPLLGRLFSSVSLECSKA